MADPSFVGFAAASGTLGADPNVDLSGIPGGMVDGYYMIAVGRAGGALAKPDASWLTDPNSLGANQPLFRRKWSTGDPTNFTFVTTGAVNSVVVIGVWSNVHTTSPVDDSDGVIGTGAMVIPSVDPLGTGRTLATLAVKLQNTTFTFSGGGEKWDALSSTQNFVTAGAEEKNIANAATGTRTATPATGAANGVAYMLVLRPATTQYFQTLSATMAGVPSIIRKAKKSLSAVLTGASTLSRKITAHRTLSVAMTGVASMIRESKKVLTVAMTGVASIRRKTGKTLSVTMVGVAILGRKTGKTLSVTMAGVPTLARRITAHRTLSVVMTVVPSLTQKITAGRNLSAVMTGSATLVRKVGKSLSVAMVGVPSLNRAITAFRELAATMVGVPSIGKRTSKTLAATMSGVPFLTKSITTKRTLSATMTGNAALSFRSVLARVLSAVMVGVPKGEVKFPWDAIPDGCPPDWSPNDGMKSITGDVFFHEPPNEGEPVSGATVTLIRDSDGSRITTTMTDASGHYFFLRDTNDPYTYHVEVRYSNQQGLSEGGCVPS